MICFQLDLNAVLAFIIYADDTYYMKRMFWVKYNLRFVLKG